MSITNVTSTKVMLTKDNYNIWLPDMEMVLQINGVVEYINERLKTIQENEIPENKIIMEGNNKSNEEKKNELNNQLETLISKGFRYIIIHCRIR